ncbi:MAG TPA: sigma 54-interacting transcriptional regulator [Polyangia bacterium]|nr:sigma 54-interacting transcriptional regulator [Polyangia bacterium]
MLGNVSGEMPPLSERVVVFQNLLRLGRRHMTDLEPGSASWAVPDRMISGQHAQIIRAGDGYDLVDLNSTNGTIVDGAVAQPRVKLRDGSLIFVGSHVAVFRMGSLAEVAAIRAELAAPLGPVPTANPTFALICNNLRKLAVAGEEILLTGETGVGKEVYARSVHEASGRRGRFVAVNCAALPRELVESELFGYVRGAHSQALSSKPGIIEEAEGGTLFLDEIGDMAPELQTKLLRFTQDRLLVPVGATRTRRIDTRILAATSRTAPPGTSGAGGLRADLAARLGAEAIRIPPLRERMEDLGALMTYLLDARQRPFELGAFQALCVYNWPGNVRELGKVITSAEALSRDAERIGPEHLPAAIAAASGRSRLSPSGRVSRPPPSKIQLEELMRRLQGNMLRVARELDRKPALVYRWAKRFGLNADDFRPKDE